VLDGLDARLDHLVETATETIFAENPTYRDREDELREDVSLHVREHLQTALESLREQREISREDVMFIRRHAGKRVGEFSVADFIHAFHVGQRILWREIVAIADDEAGAQAIVGLVAYIARYFDVATTHAAEVYVEVETLLGAASERLRRDVFEELLRGNVPPPGPLLDTLHAAGLDPARPCLVLSAISLTGLPDAHALRGAAALLAGSGRLAVPPLIVVRHQEIVIIGPVRNRRLENFLARLAACQARLARQELPLAVGVSTVHGELSEVPLAYREAASARERLAGDAGLVALPAMRTFDWLAGSHDSTARRLVPAAIKKFVAEDLAAGGVLIETLRTFADCDASIKDTANALHVHLNTARYRLARIAERTGSDPRRVRELIELLIAVELLAAPAG
jgi:hypothetical protein